MTATLKRDSSIRSVCYKHCLYQGQVSMRQGARAAAFWCVPAVQAFLTLDRLAGFWYSFLVVSGFKWYIARSLLDPDCTHSDVR